MRLAVHMITALLLPFGLVSGGRQPRPQGHYDARSYGPPLPVVWSKSLALRSARDVSRRLGAPTRDSSERAIWTLRCATTSPDAGGKPIDTVTTVTCTEFRAARVRGLSAESRLDVDDLIAVGARCAAIKAIGTARDPLHSAVRSFRLSLGSLGELPASLALAITPRDSAQLWSADRLGVSLRRTIRGAFARVEHFPTGDTVLSVSGPYERDSYEIIARGDFDGDGWDDSLVDVIAGARGGSFATNDVYVLTRRSERVPLTVVRRIW